MNITDFTIRLLLLFLPGLICSYLIDALTTHEKRKPFFFILQSLVYGFAVYLLYWLFIYILYITTLLHSIPRISFIEALLNKNTPISFSEIVFVCIGAVLFAYIYSWGLNKNLHFKVAHKLFVTKKFAEADVWEFIFNSKDIDEWITVRDHKYDLLYLGWVNAFSDSTSKKSELLLRDVSVYNNTTGEPLYQIGCMYISRDREDLTLEFGNIPITKEIIWKEKNNDKGNNQKGNNSNS